MEDSLRGISVTCFVGSYIVALLLELTRSIVRVPGRGLLTILFTVAGLGAQAIYLVVRAAEHGAGAEAGLFAGWYDWSLLVAWGLAACYLVLYLSRPDTIVGYFLLPSVLALVGLARLTRDWAPFSPVEAVGVWRSVHSLSMTVGAAAVLMGFIAGLMYLTKAWRLKTKQVMGTTLRLPNLERLQLMNRQALVASTIAVGIGLFSGVVMNVNRWGYVAWGEGGVILSGVLFAWLSVATAFEFFYKPARQGRKVVYLTLASFGFLVVTMIGVLSSDHGRKASEPSASDASLDPTSPDESAIRHPLDGDAS
ncbi:MAG: cytochrome c biogenesis protein CcsA [Planctomycetaceae bacterium]